MAKDVKTAKVDVRKILKAIVAVCAVGSAVLLLRAYFLEHPPTGTPLTSDITQLGQNSLTSLDSVNTQLNSAAVGVWGNDITDAFALPNTEGMWISVNNHQNLYIGELMDQAFTPKFVLPLNALWYHLYPDQSLLYFTLSSNTADAKLVGIKGEKVDELVHLAAGWEFNSALFDPAQKQFYIDIYDRNGKSKIQVVRQGTGSQDVVDTSAFSQPLLLNLDVTNRVLYFTAGQSGHVGCFALNLMTKQIADKDCGAIQTTPNNMVFSTNSPDVKLSTEFKGSILQNNTANGNRAFIKVGEAGDVFAKLTTNDKYLAVLYSKIEKDVDDETLLSLNLKSIRVFDVNSGTEKKEVKPLPADISFSLVDRKANVFAVTVSAEFGQLLWREPIAGETEWQSITLSICAQTCEFAAL